ncbi:amino acid adenylation domain-containing protein [Pedobacter sp. WC2423]|uniref:amino acid adenylation domain-containing protein n=1 Tax=Pedobacter sp. WC2423 TaxID=3234142 RepID=UPI0034671D48
MEIIMASSTLIQALENSRHLKDRGVTFIQGTHGDEFISYCELYQIALKALFHLQEKGIEPGHELVFQLEDNKAFVITFWACILGGIIPVPLSIGQSDDHRQKLFNVWQLLENPYLAISDNHLNKLNQYAAKEGLDKTYKLFKNKIVHPEGLLSSMIEGCLIEVKEEDTAFIQFSSGSTGSPKGVILSHRNLIANMEAISAAANYSANDTLISWMPLTHDMGLIGFHLNPLLKQINQYLIPTSLFIRRPALWLDKVHQYKATVLSSPNFGLKYVIKHCNLQLAHEWDFSKVRIIFNGAEPISKVICRNFVEQLTKFGLKSYAMRPVYGLAEATLAVSISGLEEELISVELNRNHLSTGDKIIYEKEENLAVSFLNVGKAINDCTIRVTDFNDALLQEEIIGYVQIKGINVTAGYYHNEKETLAAITGDGWFKTGDLGFIKEGALYITGRSKDVILLNGQNFYPHDIESAAEELAGVELNKISVSGFFNPDKQQEETIAFVFHRADLKSFIPLIHTLRAHINLKFGFEIDRVIPVKDVPRTTSGKLQRFKLLEQYHKGVFSVVDLEIKEMIRKSELERLLVEEPVNETEKKLLNIWKRILKKENIGVEDAFSQLGGDSLKTAELQVLIFKELAFDFPLERLHTKFTVRSQAQEIANKKTNLLTSIPKVALADYYDLSAAQKRIYYAWEMDKTDTAYNIPTAFNISGVLDADRLAQCIQQLISNHSSLRMSFVMRDEPCFMISDEVDFNMIRAKISGSDISGQLEKLIKPFDLRIAPLLRVVLLEKSETEHIIFLDFHHIVSDGISIYNFITELVKLYAGIQLTYSPLDYKDYAVWKKNRSKEVKPQLDLDYWLNQLKGDLPLLELPTDFLRPPLFETRGERMGIDIDQYLTARLRALAAAHNCRLHVLMLSFYFSLLFKYSRQQEFIIGIPVSGRSHPNLRQIHGMFVNNLAIRAEIDNDWSFLQLLGELKKIVADALGHAECSFDDLVQLLNTRRDVSRNPVFDSMFIYQNMGMPDDSVSDLNLSRLFFDHGTAKFDLSMEVFENRDTLRIDIEYSSSLFKKSTIKQMVVCFEQLINCVLEKPQTNLSKIPLLSTQLHEEYISQFNSTEKIYPDHASIYELIEKQAHDAPDRIAIDFNSNFFTYNELVRKVAKTALLLREQLKNTNGVVGLILKRSPEMIICMLAVLKAGGCYLPLDTGIQQERLKSIIHDSECALLLSDTANDERIENLKLENGNKEGIVIEEGVTLYRIETSGNAAVLNDLAYIIYTSGSTGTPKGVMIGHQQLLNYIRWAANQYVDQTAGNFPLFTSSAFDLTVTSIFTPLITGNTIVIYDELSPFLALEKVINENKVQVVKLTPSHLSLLSDQQIIVPVAGSIRRFIVGGEQLSSALATEIHRKFQGKVEIYNEYGPTETTVGSMIHLFSPDESASSVPIGLPIANTKIYLLDEYLNPVPQGMPGEIYIGGTGLAEGYLYNPELSGQLFLPNPFIPAMKVYKTGDMARRSDKGIIEYIGRLDSQVKINGYRVELSEIEKQLITHPYIKDAVVLLKSGDSNQASIYAYYIAEANRGELLTESVLRQYSTERLPYYMIPNYFIAIDHLPLTSNGKIAYQLLPVPQLADAALFSDSTSYAMEEMLLKVWKIVLNTEDITLNDDFFALGGDSIKAVQITARLFELGISLNTKDIFIYHTIGQISSHAKKTSSKMQYDQGILTGKRELLPAELWFVNQKFKEPGFYNQSLILQLKKEIDGDVLQAAFEKLIEQHDGLRTNYDMASMKCFYNNEHLKRPFIIERFRFDLIDWNNHICQFDPHSEIAMTFNSLKSGFDIAGSLLLKAAIINISGSSDYLFLTAHHLVVDGVSWRIILEDLLTIYTGLEKNEVIKLPQKTAGLNDWSEQMQGYVKSEDFSKEEKYWNAVDSYRFMLPLDEETTDWQTANLKKVTLKLADETTRFLSGAANLVFNTDVSVLLNTALILTLDSWLGSDQFIVEQENHGRHLEDIETSRSVGWFTAIYPVLFASENGSIGDLIKLVKENIKNVPQHGIGYMAVNRNSRNNTQQKSQVRFNYLGKFDAEFDNEFFTYCFIPTGNDSSASNEITAVLEFNAMIANGAFRMEIGYNSKAYHENTISNLKNVFEENLLIILQYLRDEDDVHFTPSDFTTVELVQDDLDSLFE